MSKQGVFEQILTRYLEVFPAEKQELGILLEQIERNGTGTLSSRFEFDAGHTTAAGFVLNQARNKILLIEHRFLKKLLQPGGHMEPSDAHPLDGAYREVHEEVGFSRDDLEYIPLDAKLPLVPFDLQTHTFPPREHRQEPAHYHYDCRYLFVVMPSAQMTLQTLEVEGARWVDFAEFATMPEFERQAAKIKALLSNSGVAPK